MDQYIKKKLAKNWFKTLQEVLCREIEEKESNKIKFYKSSKEFFDKNSKNRVVLMTTKASKVYTKFKFKRNDILLFGRESAGVPEDVHSKVNERIKIPMIKNKRSLNISISVAIGASEFIRQLG